MNDSSRQQVEVTDIQMRFGSMVVFMVKWAVASIPAVLILVTLAAFSWALIVGGMMSLLRGHNTDKASGVTSQLSSAKQGEATTPEEAAYLERVLVKNVKVAETEFGGVGAFGEVKNGGDRTLKEVDITIYCLGADGKPVYEDTHYPVLVNSMSFGDAADPLKPGYSRKFGYKLDSAPSDWDKKSVDVRVTRVEFQ